MRAHEEELGGVRGPRGGPRALGARVRDLGGAAAADVARVNLLARILRDGERDGRAVGGDARAPDEARGVRQAPGDAAGGGNRVQVVLAHERERVAVKRRPAEVPARVGGGDAGDTIGRPASAAAGVTARGRARGTARVGRRRAGGGARPRARGTRERARGGRGGGRPRRRRRMHARTHPRGEREAMCHDVPPRREVVIVDTD